MPSSAGSPASAGRRAVERGARRDSAGADACRLRARARWACRAFCTAPPCSSPRCSRSVRRPSGGALVATPRGAERAQVDRSLEPNARSARRRAGRHGRRVALRRGFADAHTDRGGQRGPWVPGGERAQSIRRSVDDSYPTPKRCGSSTPISTKSCAGSPASRAPHGRPRCPSGGLLRRHAVFRVDGEPALVPAERPTAEMNVVSDEYFRTLELPIVEGRAFTARTSPARPCAS